MVEQRMDGEDEVGIRLLQRTDDDPPDPSAEDPANRREGRSVVEAVIKGTPDGRRATDDGRIEPGKPAYKTG